MSDERIEVIANVIQMNLAVTWSGCEDVGELAIAALEAAGYSVVKLQEIGSCFVTQDGRIGSLSPAHHGAWSVRAHSKWEPVYRKVSE